MLVVGGNTVGGWVLLVVAIVGWAGMKVVGREHAWHSGWLHSGICRSTSCVRGWNTVDTLWDGYRIESL